MASVFVYVLFGLILFLIIKSVFNHDKPLVFNPLNTIGLVYLYYCVITYLVGGNEINPIGNNPGEAPFLCASTAL